MGITRIKIEPLQTACELAIEHDCQNLTITDRFITFKKPFKHQTEGVPFPDLMLKIDLPLQDLCETDSQCHRITHRLKGGKKRSLDLSRDILPVFGELDILPPDIPCVLTVPAQAVNLHRSLLIFEFFDLSFFCEDQMIAVPWLALRTKAQ